MTSTRIKEIDGRWYAFKYDSDRGQVMSIGADCPKHGNWFARATDTGIQYVATPSPSRRAAYQKARRHGAYGGEW